MSTWTSRVSKTWDYLFYDIADPRTSNWFLVNPPYIVWCLVVFYMYFVLSLGPRIMANRKPFDLRNFTIFYNCMQIVANLFLFCEVCYILTKINVDLKCQPVDFSMNPTAVRTAALCWWYHVLKISELIDTVIFVLRKKQNQVTALHVYHHAGMVMMTSGITRYYPGGQIWLAGLFNTFIHVFMYYYYLRCVLTPGFAKNLRWKKNLTKIQFVQFFICLAHGANTVIYDCGYQKSQSILAMTATSILTALFMNFYVKTYWKKKEHVD